jgi:hypothetical protein
MFFKTDAPAGANLYACTATNTWSVQGGITGSNCWADATSQTLKCQDPSGNVYAVVKTAGSGTVNQWVAYIGADGTPQTSQPTAGAVGAVADPGSNGVPYRSGVGTATVANANQLSGPFFCQDAGTSGAYSCNLTPAIAAYATGTTYWFRANTAATGSATLNLNGLGPKTIVKQSNQSLAANDIRSGQWVMVTYDGTNLQMQSQAGNAVSTVYGRTGAVTAQLGDYTFSQIGGTASAAQLPATAMQTNQGNTATAGTQDFSQAAHTLPMKSGSTSAMPSACSVGEAYFATDATAGANLYGCTAANTWSQQAGGGASSGITVKASGTTVGLRNTINIIPGAGVIPLVTDTGSQINIQIPIDTAVTDTRLNAASGADLRVAPSSNSGSAYVGCPSGLTPPLASGMVVHLAPDHASAGGAATFNYCSTGAMAFTESDGTTNLTSFDLVAGRQRDIWYDGALWRLTVPTANGTSGQALTGNGSGGFGTPVSLGTAAAANTGTSGATVPLLNAANTWGAAQALGSSTATTQSPDDGSTKLATTAYVDRMKLRAIGYSFSSPTSSSVAYLTVPFACTITAWNATVDTGTISWDVWKIASGTAIPTVSNSIVASAAPAIASNTALHSTAVSTWTTTVAANDIFGFKVSSASGPSIASLVLECDQ